MASPQNPHWDQAPFLCHSLQTSFVFPRYFGEIGRALNQKSGNLVSGPPSPNSPITELFQATVFLLCQMRMITPTPSAWRHCEDTVKIEQKYPQTSRRWHAVEGLGLEITHSKNMLFLKTHCQKQEWQRRFRGLSCMYTIFLQLNSLATVGKPDWVLSFSMCVEVWGRGGMYIPNLCQSLHLPLSSWKEAFPGDIWAHLCSGLGGPLPLPSNCTAQVLNLQHPYSTSQVSPMSWPISPEASNCTSDLPPQQLPQTTQGLTAHKPAMPKLRLFIPWTKFWVPPPTSQVLFNGKEP